MANNTINNFKIKYRLANCLQILKTDVLSDRNYQLEYILVQPVAGQFADNNQHLNC